MKKNEHADMTAALFTLGCKVNQYESRAMTEKLLNLGVEIRSGGKCDIYIINTCAVTAESDRKARQIIRRCMACNPDAVIAVCGCSSQLNRSRITGMEGVDIVCGSAHKYTAADKAYELALSQKYGSADRHFTDRSPENTFKTDDEYDCSMKITGFDRVRAYVKIEDGCNARCAYCIIPHVRGPVRSREPSAVITEIQTLAASGCREVVLTGIETSAYGHGLTGLLQKVDKIEGIERIRLGSMDPAFINKSFTDDIKQMKHFMPHLHISLQSGCSRTLAAMRRRYNAETAYGNLCLLKESIPEMRFSADLIVGFPGETEEDFKETLVFAEKAGFLHIHIFAFSKRPGTEAASMADQIGEEEKKERGARLSLLQLAGKKEMLDSVVREGKKASVLFETFKDGRLFGHAEDFTEYTIEGDRKLHGLICGILPLSHDGNIITGKTADGS